MNPLMREAHIPVRTVEQFFSLPVFEQFYVEEHAITEENCAWLQQQLGILHLVPGTKIRIPRANQLFATYVGADEIMFAVDEGGHVWVRMGNYRRRASC